MKYWRMMQVMTVSLLCAASVIAADKTNKATITVTMPVTVSGKTLVPGYYQVTWEDGTGQVQLTFLQGKKVVATASAKIQPRDVAYDDTVLVTRGNDLQEIRPKGRKHALRLDLAPPTQ